VCEVLSARRARRRAQFQGRALLWKKGGGASVEAHFCKCAELCGRVVFKKGKGGGGEHGARG
jgi:hypothetical protein